MIYNRSGLVILFLSFLALLAGIAVMIGRADNTSPSFRAIGGCVVFGTGTLLFLTARRWAGYFFALCGIAAVKAVLALLFGVTVAVPRLVTDRKLVFELLCLLGGLSLLTYRFVTTRPESHVQTLALVIAVIGLAWAMLIEPNMWPLIGSVAVLTISWTLQRFAKQLHGGK
jgi:hypothetical protein